MWVAPQRESAQFTQAHQHRHSNFQAIERGVGVAGVRGRDGHPSSDAIGQRGADLSFETEHGGFRAASSCRRRMGSQGSAARERA